MQYCVYGHDLSCTELQSWPKLCGTSLQNALPRPSISFSHRNKRSLDQIPPPPLPPCNVRKERLADELSNIASGGRGERANIAAIREKGTLSHTFWPGLSISLTFATNAHNSKCMERTVSKFVWVKFVQVLHMKKVTNINHVKFDIHTSRFQRSNHSCTPSRVLFANQSVLAHFDEKKIPDLRIVAFQARVINSVLIIQGQMLYYFIC